MRTYARVENGVVYEIIAAVLNEDDAEVPIEERFTPEVIDDLVDITDVTPRPGCWWTFDGEIFSAPIVHEPTPEDIERLNSGVRDTLLSAAASEIGPLQDAVDLDMASAEEKELLASWKRYRVLVNRVDLTVADPTWPARPDD